MTEAEGKAWKALALAQQKLLACYRTGVTRRAGSAVDAVTSAKDRLRELGIDI